MEQEKNQNIAEQAEERVKESGSKGFNAKILLIGLPLFIIQLIAVYFITANILLPKIQSHTSSVAVDSVENGEANANDSIKHLELGKYVYVVEDLIINPAGTDGKRLLLTSIGFDLLTDQNQKELKEKEVLVKDAVISVLSSKDMTHLSDALYRDTLRMEISQKITQLIPDVKINNVYFSKYILQ
ncbi:flagellar basal body-associated FliL family protein [Rosettibacter firmus]|uniref:flagellar basal body-associated FliL family protein n=1 Tax=Rosettibacter firmus TaxID=3111522 RepID=UPI00336C2894